MDAERLHASVEQSSQRMRGDMDHGCLAFWVTRYIIWVYRSARDRCSDRARRCGMQVRSVTASTIPRDDPIRDDRAIIIANRRKVSDYEDRDREDRDREDRRSGAETERAGFSGSIIGGSAYLSAR